MTQISQVSKFWKSTPIDAPITQELTWTQSNYIFWIKVHFLFALRFNNQLTLTAPFFFGLSQICWFNFSKKTTRVSGFWLPNKHNIKRAGQNIIILRSTCRKSGRRDLYFRCRSQRVGQIYAPSQYCAKIPPQYLQ